ncbi:hypothetical protein BC936DRAFT_138122, partial [Jimgerdemannia flammicorona]
MRIRQLSAIVLSLWPCLSWPTRSGHVVDVLVIGAGPVGLFAAYNWTCLPNRSKVAGQRACNRAQSKFSQASELIQLGFCNKFWTTYNNGVQVDNMSAISDSKCEFDYMLLHLERVLNEALMKHGVVVEGPVTIERLEVSEEEDN